MDLLSSICVNVAEPGRGCLDSWQWLIWDGGRLENEEEELRLSIIRKLVWYVIPLQWFQVCWALHFSGMLFRCPGRKYCDVVKAVLWCFHFYISHILSWSSVHIYIFEGNDRKIQGRFFWLKRFATKISWKWRVQAWFKMMAVAIKARKPVWQALHR